MTDFFKKKLLQTKSMAEFEVGVYIFNLKVIRMWIEEKKMLGARNEKSRKIDKYLSEVQIYVFTRGVGRSSDSLLRQQKS